MIIDMEMVFLVFWAIRTSLLIMDVDSTGLTMIRRIAVRYRPTLFFERNCKIFNLPAL